MDKRNLFEQLNFSAYANTTDPFSVIVEAGHFGNLEDYATASSEEDPETGSFREGEPSKIEHKLTDEELEAEREKANAPEDERDFEGAITGLGHGRKRDTEVPLEYNNDADIAVSYDPWSEEEVNREPIIGDELESDYETPLTDEEDIDVLGETEPGPGGEEDLGTPSTKLPNTKQAELAAKLDTPMNNKELLALLADYLKKTLQDEGAIEGDLEV